MAQESSTEFTFWLDICGLAESSSLLSHDGSCSMQAETRPKIFPDISDMPVAALLSVPRPSRQDRQWLLCL